MNHPENEANLQQKISQLEASLHDVQSELKSKTVELEAYEGLLKLAMDDMKRIYEDLLMSHSQLMQSDKLAAIGTLSAGVIHEINNPLFAIQGVFFILKDNISQIQSLSEKCALPSGESQVLFEEVNNSMSRGIQCAEHIAKIVKDIRVFSRSDKGERAQEDINAILESIVSIAWSAMKNKVELKKLYGQLPKISCNRQQLGQVFLNLVVNASQAIETRGMITLKTFLEGPSVKIEISDTGNGIPEEIKNRIFEPFFTTKGAETGTGLGLSVSADIIKKHSGKMEVLSQVGKGTTFIITLPVSSEEAAG